MLIEALFGAIAVQSLDAFDDANLALTTCGFATYRYANERDQTTDEFARALSSRCSEAIAQLRRTIIAVEIQRGKSEAAASTAADALIAQFRTQFANDYAKRAESEARLRELERALQAGRKPDAQ